MLVTYFDFYLSSMFDQGSFLEAKFGACSNHLVVVEVIRMLAVCQKG